MMTQSKAKDEMTDYLLTSTFSVGYNLFIVTSLWEKTDIHVRTSLYFDFIVVSFQTFYLFNNLVYFLLKRVTRDVADDF